MRVAALLIALALLAPVASAHGAPVPREVDDRLLADQTSNGDYGASGNLDEGALDLLALDVREVHHASLGPSVVFRIIVQGGDTTAGDLQVTLHLRSGGEARSFSFTSSASGLSHDFDLLEGPFDVGDGHPKAYDAFLTPATLGILAGAAINDIRLESSVGDSTGDVMPGSWFFAGNEIPMTGDAADPARYMTTGPARLFTLSGSASILDTSNGPVEANVSLASLLTETDQVVRLAVSAPEGITAGLTSDSLILAAGQGADLGLRVEGSGVGEVRIEATSDLHGYALLSIPILGNVLSGYDAEVKSGDLLPGDSYQYRLSSTGVFEYHCHPHPWMIGNVTVVDAINGTSAAIHTVRIVEPDAGDPQSWAFEPADLTIRLGDVVVWTNEGQMIHDVHGNLGGEHDHSHHDHGEAPPAKESPGMPLLWLLVAIALVAQRRR